MCTGTSIAAIAAASSSVSAGTAAAIGVAGIAAGAALSSMNSKDGPRLGSPMADAEAERKAAATRAAQEAQVTSNLRRAKKRSQFVLGGGVSIEKPAVSSTASTYGKTTLGG